MSDTVFDLKAQVSADATPFTRAMDASATSVDSSLKAISSAVNMYIGNSVVQSFVKAINVAADFGQVMADISSISEISTKKLADTISKVGNEYGKMADIGNSIYETISSGIDGTEQELVDFTKSISRAAKSIRADVASTSNVVTTLTNAYGLGIKDVDKIADMLFVTVREGKAQGNELARTMGLVTNTAAEAGIKFEELSAAISILSRTQSASQSMIGLNQMLNGLINPTIEARKEAERWGIEIGATALKTKGFTGILTELHDKVGGNVEAINKILGNIRAMRAGVALTGKQYENFIDVLRSAETEIGTGVAAEAFAKQTATTKQALENLEVQVDKTLKSIGDDFEPLTRHVAEFGEKLLINLTNMNGLSKFSVYLSVISGIITGIVNTVKYLKKIYTEISSALERFNKGMTTSSDNAKVLRTEMQRTAEALNMIEARMSVVGGLSSQQQIQRKFDSYLDDDNLTKQAIANLGIKHVFSKDDYVELPKKVDTEAVYAEAYRNALREPPYSGIHGVHESNRDVRDTSKSKKLPDDYLSQESINAEVRKRMGNRHPDVIRTDAMAKSMERATAVITKFNEAVNNVNAHINAAFTPDVRRAELKAMQEAKYKIPEIAKRNIEQTYRRTSNGKLQDPLTGQFVNEPVVLWREEKRLKKELGKQRAARIAAERLEAKQKNAQAKAEKEASDLRVTVAKERIVEVKKAKLKEANQAAIDAKAQKVQRAKEEQARMAARNAVIKAEEQYGIALNKARAHNASIDAKIAEQGINLATEKGRLAGVYNEGADKLKRQLANEERNRNIVSRSRRRFEEADAEAAAGNVGNEAKGIKKYFKILGNNRAKNLKALRRQYMAKDDQAALLERYNKRFDKEYQSLAEVTSRTTRHWSGTFNRILGRGSVLTKLYNGFNALNMSISAWVTGWEIGKALGEKMEMSDSLLVQWIDKLRNRINGESELDLDEVIRRDAELDAKKLVSDKQENQKLINKLYSTEKITAAELEYYSILNNINGSASEVAKLYDKLKDKLNASIQVSQSIETAEILYKKAEEKYRKAIKDLEDRAKNGAVQPDYSPEQKAAIDTVIGQLGFDTATSQKLSARAKTIYGGSSLGAVIKPLLNDKAFMSNPQNMVALRKLAIEAIESDPILVTALYRQGTAKYYADWDTDEARRDFFASKGFYTSFVRDRLNSGKYDDDLKNILHWSMIAEKASKDIAAIRNRGKVDNKAVQAQAALQTFISEQADAIVTSAQQRMLPFNIQASQAYRERGLKYTRDSDISKIMQGADEAVFYEQLKFINEHVTELNSLVSIYNKLEKHIQDNGLSGNADAQAALLRAKNSITSYFKHVADSENEVINATEQLIAVRESNLTKAIDAMAVKATPGTSAYNETLVQLLKGEIDSATNALDDILRSEQGKKLTEPQKQALRRTYNNYIMEVREKLGSAVFSIVDDYTNAYSESIAGIENNKAISEAKNKTKDISEAKRLAADKSYAENRLSSLKRLITAIDKARKSLDSTKDAEDIKKLDKTYNEYKRQEKLLTAEISSLGKQIALAKQAAAQQSNITLMDAAQDFAGQRSNGVLDNNALYHSLNLTARVGQTNMMRSLVKGTYAPNSINVNKAMMNREKAQQAVSASIDAYMMSQKYAEANMGKTIVDIYNYMRNNNTTMVRR